MLRSLRIKSGEDPSLIDSLAIANLAVIIDPIDGTWNYAHGLGNFGSIMAVVSHGKPIWGLLYDPYRDDWVEASPGEGALFKTSNGPGGRRLEPPTHKTALRDLSGFVPVRQFPKKIQNDIF
jgi:fructose-1,6-bisphosphatase/inositol monophosphatase family enzyme